jgi:segregation and condensation protein B
MELKFIIEALLFSAQKPLTPRELRDVLNAAAAEPSSNETVRSFKRTKEEDIDTALEQIKADHEQLGRSYRLVCVAGSWQFVSQTDYAPWLMAMVGQKIRPPRLSQPSLETLAILAYRQPITRAEIEQIRGVAVDGVMQTLVERGLVEQVGRAEVVGRPMMYGTTPLFLEYFGLRSLEDLPAADELRRIPVVKPEALLTVENGHVAETPAEGAPSAETAPSGLATPPPTDEQLSASPETPSAEPRDESTSAAPTDAPPAV